MDDTRLRPSLHRRRRLGDTQSVTFVGGPRDGWRDAYHLMLTMPTSAFLAMLAAGYLLINCFFAGIYFIQPGSVTEAHPGRFWDDFFFSVQILGSLGYGVMAPRTLYAHIVVTGEVFVGLLYLAIATGLLFARVSRPTARIMFSNLAVVSPFNGEPTLMLRAANRRRNLVLEAEVTLTLAHDAVTTEGRALRRFDPLTPVRARTPLFFLTWQIMHRIDADSPLYGETAESLAARNAEIVVIIRGLDETFVTEIHARASYLPNEIFWGRRLADILSTRADGRRVVDFGRFHDLDAPPSPSAAVPPLP